MLNLWTGEEETELQVLCGGCIRKKTRGQPFNREGCGAMAVSAMNLCLVHTEHQRPDQAMRSLAACVDCYALTKDVESSKVPGRIGAELRKAEEETAELCL